LTNDPNNEEERSEIKRGQSHKKGRPFQLSLLRFGGSLISPNLQNPSDKPSEMKNYLGKKWFDKNGQRYPSFNELKQGIIMEAVF